MFKVDPNVIKLQNNYSGWKKRISEAGVGFKTLTERQTVGPPARRRDRIQQEAKWVHQTRNQELGKQ